MIAVIPVTAPNFGPPAPPGLCKLAAGGWKAGPTAGPTLAVDRDTMTVRAVISTAAPDRAGDVVVPSGLRNADEYLRNPVVLWAHQRALAPVGTCVRLDVLTDRVVAETRFARGNPLAEEVFRLCAEGVLRGWSVGFLPRRARLAGTGPLGRPALRVEEWDLLEYSVVPVPENPAALTLPAPPDALGGLFQNASLKRR